VFNFTDIKLNQGIAETVLIYDSPASANLYNNFLFKDAEVDALLDKGRTLTDYAARKQVYDDLQAMLAQKAPVISCIAL